MLQEAGERHAYMTRAPGYMIVRRATTIVLNKELAAVLAASEVKPALFLQGLEATSSTPEALGRYMKGEFDKWSALIVKARIEAN